MGEERAHETAETARRDLAHVHKKGLDAVFEAFVLFCEQADVTVQVTILTKDGHARGTTRIVPGHEGAILFHLERLVEMLRKEGAVPHIPGNSRTIESDGSIRASTLIKTLRESRLSSE